MGGLPRKPPGRPRPPRAQRLRLGTINFWGIEAPLTKRVELVVNQLEPLDLDVVCMQEVRPLDGRSGETTADVIGSALGFEVHYRRSLAWHDDDFFPGHPGGQEGLAILSRYRVLEVRHVELPERRPTEGRILLSACIEHPAGPVWVHTTHHHYRLEDGIARERQVLAVDDVVAAIGENPQIVCGDFNAPPDSDEMRFLRGLATLDGRRTHFQDAWLRCHPDAPGLTWSAENENTRALRSLDIDRRIDYIYVTTRRKDGRGTVIEASVILDEPGAGGAMPSDHFGVLADIVVFPSTR